MCESLALRWNNGNPGLIVQPCLCSEKRNVWPTSPPPPTATLLKRPHTKNNKGRKHPEHMVVIYWYFLSGDGA